MGLLPRGCKRYSLGVENTDADNFPVESHSLQTILFAILHRGRSDLNLEEGFVRTSWTGIEDVGAMWDGQEICPSLSSTAGCGREIDLNLPGFAIGSHYGVTLYGGSYDKPITIRPRFTQSSDVFVSTRGEVTGPDSYTATFLRALTSFVESQTATHHRSFQHSKTR